LLSPVRLAFKQFLRGYGVGIVYFFYYSRRLQKLLTAALFLVCGNNNAVGVLHEAPAHISAGDS
jgi:hypothetical protein